MHKLFLFYKMQNGLVPDYLTELVPSRVGDNTTYSLRNAEHLQQIHASSRLYFDSFLPSTIREWNRLPSDTKSAHPYHHLSISLRKTFRRSLNINTVMTESVRYYTQDLKQNAAY